MSNEAETPKPQRTTKQIRANRENAKKSTGPKTTPGKNARPRTPSSTVSPLKARSRPSSSTKASSTSSRTASSDSSTPISTLEITLVDRIVSLMWRLQRVPLMEAATLNHICEDGKKFAALLWSSNPLGTIARYEGHLDRALHRTLKELERIQKLRNATHFAFRTTNWHIAQEEMDYYDQHYGPRTFQSEPAETHTIPPQAISDKPQAPGEAQSYPNAQRPTRNTFTNSQPGDPSDPSDLSDQTLESSKSLGTGDPTDPTDPTDKSAKLDLNGLPKPLLIQFVDDEEENDETNPLNLFSPSKEGPGGNIYPR